MTDKPFTGKLLRLKAERGSGGVPFLGDAVTTYRRTKAVPIDHSARVDTLRNST
jgi:hypothetical protein